MKDEKEWNQMKRKKKGKEIKNERQLKNVAR